MVKASAPGKVHLIGEHAVVYGEPAILAAVSLRCFATAERNDDNKIRIINRGRFTSENSVKEILEVTEEVDNLLDDGDEKNDFSRLFAFLKEDPKRYSYVYAGKTMKILGINEGMNLDMWTEIPLGAGLGSSAAFGVAMTKAISKAFGKDLSKEEVNDIAFSLEKYCHGRPSGGDNSACSHGGLIWFKKGPEKPEIKYLDVPKLENFILVYSGRPEKSTGDLVQQVRKTETSLRDSNVKSIGAMVPEMLEALKEKDYVKIRELINNSWDKLKAFGLSTENIDKIVEAVREIGGAAKACGSCGGGIVLCQHDDKELLKKTLRGIGFEPIETDLGVEGVRLE